jgi:hypothetical protein
MDVFLGLLLIAIPASLPAFISLFAREFRAFVLMLFLCLIPPAIAMASRPIYGAVAWGVLLLMGIAIAISARRERRHREVIAAIREQNDRRPR